jgi:hypothetical protein
LENYNKRIEREKQLGIEEVRNKFNSYIQQMSSTELENFENGILPSSLSDIITVDPITGNFVSKKY